MKVIKKTKPDFDTKYKNWSVEKLGLVKITALNDNYLAHMDRIVILDEESSFGQLIYRVQYNGSYFSFLFYYVVEIEGVYRFVDSSTVLESVDSNLYTISDNKIVFDSSLNTWTNPQLYVRYKQ